MEDNQSAEFAVKAVFHKEVYLDKFTVFFFFFWKLKGRTLFFFQQKSAVRVGFKCKLYLKQFNIDTVLLNDIHKSKRNQFLIGKLN